MNTERLITQLSTDLKASPRRLSLFGVSACWLAVSVSYVLVMMVALGSFRPGFGEQLVDYPRFLIEMMVGAAAIGILGVCSIASAIPGRFGN